MIFLYKIKAISVISIYLSSIRKRFHHQFLLIRNKGFTLVELLLYMGLLSILIGVLTTIFTLSLNDQLSSQGTASVQQDGQYILSRFIYDIKRAESINSPVLGGTTNTLQLVINSIPYTYSLDANNNLLLAENAVSNQLNSYNTSVSGLSFQEIGSASPSAKNTIVVNFTLTSKVASASGRETKSFQTTIGTR